MNLFQICISITIVATLVPSVLVIINHPRRRINQFCLILSVVIAGWLLALAMASISTTEEAAKFWIRQSTAASALLPIVVHLLRLVMVKPDVSWHEIGRRSMRWFAAYIVMVAICQTDWFLRAANMPATEMEIPLPEYGPGIAAFVVYMSLMILTLLYTIRRDLKEAQGIRRMELQFIILGCISSLAFGVLVIVVSNIAAYENLSQILPLSVIFFNTTLAYGVATKNILEVPYLVRRTLVAALVVVYLGVVYFATWYSIDWLVRIYTQTTIPFAHLVATLVVALTATPVHGSLSRFASRLFVSSPQLDVGKTIQEASRLFNTISTVDELVEAVNTLIENKFGSEKVWFLLEDNYCYIEAKRNSVTSRENSVVLQSNSPLVLAVQQYKEAIVLDTLGRRRPDPLLQDAGEQMKKIGAHVVAGISSKTGMEGIILLGPRPLGRLYGVVEQQAIEGLCGQLAVSLENAKLYTEVQNSRIYNDILLDRLVGGVIAVNNARRITVFNREAQRIAGLSHEEVINQDLSVLPEPLSSGLEQAFTQGGSRHVETVLVSNNEEVPIQYGCTLFHGHTGKVLGALMVFSDQTEIKKLQYQIRRTDRLASLGTLAAGMAHEIKNPLVSLKTFSQLLPERYDDPDFRETFSVLLGDEVHRIDRIVNQLLRFARPAKPSLSPINLHTVADNTLNLVKQQMRKHNIGVVRQYNAASDSIMGDGDMLTQAMLNFFLNAIDAMGESGELILVTDIISENTNQLDLWGRTIQTQRVRLSIIDNGKGIEEEDLLHVFDPFFTTKASGTGLGLSVSHGIIQEHNGAIDVESELGVGTKLHLTFPLISEEANIES